MNVAGGERGSDGGKGVRGHTVRLKRHRAWTVLAAVVGLGGVSLAGPGLSAKADAVAAPATGRTASPRAAPAVTECNGIPTLRAIRCFDQDPRLDPTQLPITGPAGTVTAQHKERSMVPIGSRAQRGNPVAGNTAAEGNPVAVVYYGCQLKNKVCTPRAGLYYVHNAVALGALPANDQFHEAYVSHVSDWTTGPKVDKLHICGATAAAKAAADMQPEKGHCHADGVGVWSGCV